MMVILLGGAAVAARAQAGQGLRLEFAFSRVVLASGDTLSGPVAVNLATDLLYLVQPDGTLRTFAPAAVAAFAVQGERPHPALTNTQAAQQPDPQQVRLFRTLAWSRGRAVAQPEPAFFEQLSAGPVLLLRRQHLERRVLPLSGVGGYNGTAGTVTPGVFGSTNGQGGVGRGLAPPPAPTRYGTLAELRDAYFLALPTGEIRPLRAARKDVLAAFPHCGPQLEVFARQHRLGYGSARELAELVRYANSLAGAPAP